MPSIVDFQKLDFVLCKKETDVIQDNIQYKIVEEFRIVQMSNFSAFELFSLNFNATKCLTLTLPHFTK